MSQSVPPANHLFGADAYSPKEIAAKVESVGIIKARLPLPSMIMLGLLAGGFIGLGAMFYTVVVSDPDLGFSASRVVGGLTFSLGLILVIVAGAELFTGNNLLVMTWVANRISSADLAKNLTIVYASNFLGAIGLAGLIWLSRTWEMNDSRVGLTAIKIAATKTAMPFAEAFFKGILCNILVCLAVWLAMAGHSVTDKILAIVFPITAFVAAGFEHCVANMYFIPLGLLLREHYESETFETLNLSGLAENLIPVTLGNIVGGAVFVGLVYYIIYRRNAIS